VLALVLAPALLFGAILPEFQPINSDGIVCTIQIKDFPEVHFFAGVVELSQVEAPALDNFIPMPFDASGITAIEQARPAVTAAEPSGIPTKLALEQNYPNPFNPTTMIRYALPASTRVKLTVHTLLGNQIKVLVDQWQDAGSYSFDFSAQDLPSGAYFYRLQTDLGTITRRMIVSK
jgi:hypothetical protein